MKKLIFLISIFVLWGCNNPIDKSVLIPLSEDELSKIVQKDSLFELTNFEIQYIRDNVLDLSADNSKWDKLTYRRVHKLMTFQYGTDNLNPTIEQAEKDWQIKYGKYPHLVDSVLQYWKNFEKENSLESMLKIELASINKDYYSGTRRLRDINLGFRLTPLKGTVDQVQFSYYIEPKISEDRERPMFSFMDKEQCVATSPITRPTVRYWRASYKNRDLLSNHTLETFLRDYNIEIEIRRLRKDGQNISQDDIKIPRSIRRYWEQKENESLIDFYKTRIIEELLNDSYISEFEFVYNEITKVLREKDPLTIEFFELTRD